MKDRISTSDFKDGLNSRQIEEICEKILDGKTPETSGKFGTGFITTYLLSKNIEISGDLTMNTTVRPFKLVLNRTPEDPDEMCDTINGDMK
jgi:hypothetical protein